MSANRISVIIADDERLICDLIIKTIHWDELGLELSATAANGEELYGLIVEKKPDIVITDICMPDLNGIELIERIRERGIPCRFIIISGYRQFEYAHKAMRFSVDDYILKPIDSDELNGCLKRIVTTLENRGDQPYSNDINIENHQGYQRYVINHILDCGERGGHMTVESANAEFGTAFALGRYRFAVIKLDLLENTNDKSRNATAVSESIAQTIKTHTCASCYYIAAYASIDTAVFLLNYAADKENAVLNALTDGFHISEHVADLFIGLKITLGIGGGCDAIGDSPKSYREAIIALYCRMIRQNDTVIRFDSLKLNRVMPGDEARLTARALDAVKVLDIHSLQAIFDDITKNLTDEESAVRICSALENLCEPLSREIAPRLEKPVSPEYLYNELLQGLRAAYSPRFLAHTFFESVLSFVGQLNKEAQTRIKRPIRQAIQYMRDNFSSPIKLEDVAGSVFLSPHYFSNLFVQETGRNFSDYLIQLRMESAKKYLCETNLSISQIASKVGYIDARYFSKVFIKEIGVKPKEYRKIYG